MSDPFYRAVLSGRNIGVLLGQPSNGLCSIDIDDESQVEPFLELNPALRDTLQSRGARGRNFWVRIEGDYPKLTKLFLRDAKDEKGQPKDWGEWRATGGQTVIHGKHPSGCDYQIIRDVQPVRIPFDAIVWPESLDVPWDAGLYDELVKQQGPPFKEHPITGAIQLNHMFFVGKFAMEHLVLRDVDEQEFYDYDQQHGLWRKQTVDSVKRMFSEDMKGYADAVGESSIERKRTNSLLTGYAVLLCGQVEKRGAFNSQRGFIHVGNGMLHLDCVPPELRGFSPSYYSRNQCPVPIIQGADCPRFKEQLLATALDEDDISLLQRWCGSLLLGGNRAQRIMLLSGTAGGGKSTLVEVIEAMVGIENTVELRTDHLGEKFELYRYLGKTFLTGKDVPSEFLMRKGAPTLKKLVGHDLLTPEGKNSNECFTMRGDFGVAITCNSRLRVKLEGDADAWRRRLMVVEYNRPKPVTRIAEFAKLLISEEASGILNWMLAGALAHSEELRDSGDFVLTPAQKARVDVLLAESDSVREFVRAGLRPSSKPSATVTVELLTQAYASFCARMDWYPVAPATVQKQLPDLVMEIHGIAKRNDIQTTWGIQRGFKGLEICSDYES